MSVLSAGGSGLLGAVILGAGLSGWYFNPVSIPERIMLCAAGIMLILPGWPGTIAGMAIALGIWALRNLRPGAGRAARP